MNNDLRIKIKVDSNTGELLVTRKEFDKLGKSVDGVSKSQKNLTKDTNSLITSSGILTSATIATTAAFYAMGQTLYSTLKNGIAYNKSIEDSRAGLTALAVAVQDKAIPISERYNQAQRESVATLKELQKINTQTPHSLNETNQIYKAMYVSMRNVGATTDEMVELTRSLSIASGAAGIEFNSLLAGVDGLATGTVLANSDLGRFLSSLGLTNEALKNSDDVVKLLVDNLKDFKAADTLGVAISNLGNEWDVLSGKLSEDIFKGSKDGANELARLLGALSEKELNDLKSSMNTMASAGITAIYGMSVGAVELSNAFESLGARIAGVAYRISEGLFLNENETKALEAMYQKTKDNIAARNNFLEILDKSRKTLLESIATSEKVTSAKKEETAAFIDNYEKAIESENAIQILKDMEDQLAREAQAVSNAFLEENQIIQENTQQKEINADATDKLSQSTIQLAEATSFLYDTQGNLRDDVFRPSTGGVPITATYTTQEQAFSNAFTAMVKRWESEKQAATSAYTAVETYTSTTETFIDTTYDAIDVVEEFIDVISNDFIDGITSTISSLSSIGITQTFNAVSYQSALANIIQKQKDLVANPLDVDLGSQYSDAYGTFVSSSNDYLGNMSNFKSKNDYMMAQSTIGSQASSFESTAMATVDVLDSMNTFLGSINQAFSDGILSDEEKLVIAGVATTVNTKNEALLGTNGAISIAVGSQKYYDNTGLATDSNISAQTYYNNKSLMKDATFKTADVSGLYTGGNIGVTETTPLNIGGLATDENVSAQTYYDNTDLMKNATFTDNALTSTQLSEEALYKGSDIKAEVNTVDVSDLATDENISSQTYYDNTDLAKNTSLIGTNSISSVLSAFSASDGGINIAGLTSGVSALEVATQKEGDIKIATEATATNTAMSQIKSIVSGSSDYQYANPTNSKTFYEYVDTTNYEYTEEPPEGTLKSVASTMHRAPDAEFNGIINKWTNDDWYESEINYEYYAQGGFTGSGLGRPDSSGFKPAGIVHEDEWVAPKWMVQNNPSLFGALEMHRLGKSSVSSTSSNTASSSNSSNKTDGYLYVLQDEMKQMNFLLRQLTDGGNAMKTKAVS